MQTGERNTPPNRDKTAVSSHKRRTLRASKSPLWFEEGTSALGLRLLEPPLAAAPVAVVVKLLARAPARVSPCAPDSALLRGDFIFSSSLVSCGRYTVFLLAAQRRPAKSNLARAAKSS